MLFRGLFLLPLEFLSMMKDEDPIKATKNCRLSPVIGQRMEVSHSHLLKEGLCGTQGGKKTPARKLTCPRLLPEVP